MDQETKNAIINDALSRGLAFVEDEFTEDGVYNPLVDRFNAEVWLSDLLDSIK